MRPLRQPLLNPWVAGLLAAAVVVAGLEAQRGAPGSLLPHGYCFTWNPVLLWTHVTSDGLIGAAYVTIPVTLLQLVRKRTDLPFNWVVVLFALFILSCGATHWIEIWTVWHPDYWLAANVKVVTAIASVSTAAMLVRLLPKILAIPTVAELTAAHDALQREVAHRREAEEALRAERADLERRVLERTEALTRATLAAASAQAAADDANKLKDRFLAKVSHELRTPLQSTMTWAQLLHRSPDNAQRAAQASDRILHNVRTQARLIDDLLDISRILSGKLSLQFHAVDGAQVVRKAVDVVRSASSGRRITIDLQMRASKASAMHTDGVRLEQVVWNLVNNAVQATTDEGRVEVVCGVDADTFTVAVRDWGRGIDAAELPRIFEPFRQIEDHGNAHRGLGLGLAIARNIVELFGGELQAQSEGKGRGATFTLRLPLDAAGAGDAEVPVTELEDVEKRRLNGLRVLYVEDEPDIAEGGRLALTALGAAVTLCTDYASAAGCIDRGGFDILLSDLNLGAGRTALDLVRRLRGTPHGAALPAIVLSAYGSADDRLASAQAGFVEHLVKPADDLQVARALLAALPQAATT